MSDSFLSRLHVKNYRALADVSLEPGKITVLSGPNGVGKSTFLDAAWFIRECAIRGTDEAASKRGHGIGMLWENSEENTPIEITIETEDARYSVLFGFSSGRIETCAGEKLYSKIHNLYLIERQVGSDKALFRPQADIEKIVSLEHEANKLFISRYLLEYKAPEVIGIDDLLRGIRYYHARSANFYYIRERGSEAGQETRLLGRGDNLWSVLRNLQGKQALDDRYKTIIQFMRKAFPGFKDFVLEPLGQVGVYGQFIEEGRKPIYASGVSDGHLQMLLNLTALFGEQKQESKLIFMDEPDLSLHPWALAILGEAIREVAEKWGKQIILATHSPVLVSQFSPSEIIAVEMGENRAAMFNRLSEIPDIQDLLEQYASGSLYMAEVFAPQSSTFAKKSGYL
jgi:predicted ATPase